MTRARTDYLGKISKTEIRNLIDKGLTGACIARLAGVSRQRVNFYLKETALNIIRYYKQKDAKEKQQKEHAELTSKRQELSDLLLQITKNKIEDPLLKKAVDFYFTYKLRNIGIYDLEKIFREYETIKEIGQKVEYTAIMRKTGINAQKIRDILYISGDIKEKKTRIVTKEKKKQLIMDLSDMLTPADITYFVGVEKYIIISLQKARRESHHSFSKEHQKFKYKVAFQIYQLENLGEQKEDIMKKLKINERTYDFCIKNKRLITPKLDRVMWMLHRYRALE